MAAASRAGVMAAVVAMGSATSPAWAEDETYATVANLIDRVGRLEQRLSGPALAQMVGQSEELRADVQSLRGEMEELTHQLEELKQQQQEQFQELSQRIQAMSAGAAAPGGKPPATSPSVSGESNGEAAKPAVEADSEAAQQAYQKAFNSVKEGRYKEGITLFKNFLASYPSGENADNAQYWLGECYYVTRDLNNAREASRKLLDTFPNSPKAADALLRLGYIEYDGQKWAAASQFFADVVKRFPGSGAAKKAQERMQQMKKEGH